jgi:hypothetical protein
MFMPGESALFNVMLVSGKHNYIKRVYQFIPVSPAYVVWLNTEIRLPVGETAVNFGAVATQYTELPDKPVIFRQ